MRRLAASSFLLLILCSQGFPQSSGMLVEDAALWDGKTIVFTGEAIGEAMRRGDMAWIHLNDDAYMWRNIEEGAALGGTNTGMAVWVSAELATGITYFGDYQHEGDVVEVTGVFHAASPEHGGDMVIHATALRVVRIGHPVDHPVNGVRLAVAAGMLVLTAIAVLIRALARRKRT